MNGMDAAMSWTPLPIAMLLFLSAGCTTKSGNGVEPMGPAQSADGGDASAQSPDGGDAAAQLPDGGDAAGPTPEGGIPPVDAAAGPHAYYGNVVPVSKVVADNLRAIAAHDATRNRRVFMKVGDSITVNCNFSCCFAPAQGAVIDLGGRTELQTTVDYFSEVKIGSSPQTTSWDRASLSARVGELSTWALEGSSPALFEEVNAINPGFAVLMLGTNDNGSGTFEYYLGPRAYRTVAGAFVKMVDELSARGIVPIITYIPPVLNEAARGWLTPAFNAVLRGVATAKLVPTIDFYSPALSVGASAFDSDGIHPLAHPTSACLLNAAGLAYGYNIRNLTTLEVLDKVRQVVVDGKTAVDAEPQALAGDGSLASPVQIPALPFALSVDLAGATNKLSNYAACGLKDPASGHERVYQLTVTEGMPVRAIVVPPTGACETAPGEGDYLCGGSRDVGLALFKGTPDQGECLAWDSTRIERWLSPGTYSFVVDSFGAQPSYAIFSVHACHPDDTACKP